MRPTKTSTNDLIYDVGMHRGEDTEFYLKKGFRVVGFEADPDLVRACHARFRSEIKSGQLTVISGAITRSPSGQSVSFYRNRDVSVWGTADAEMANRNERFGTTIDVVEVDVVNFQRVLNEHGIPYYLKVDIEGTDIACIEALESSTLVPCYISIESNRRSFHGLRDEVRLLSDLGYDAFQPVQQSTVDHQIEPDPCREGLQTLHRFSRGSSGLFGRDLPERWMTESELLNTYERIFRDYRRWGDDSWYSRHLVGRAVRKLSAVLARRPLPGWYDTHARHRSAAHGMRRPPDDEARPDE